MGQKRLLRISSYKELHTVIVELVKILETVFELRILRGTATRYKMAETENEDSSDD